MRKWPPQAQQQDKRNLSSKLENLAKLIVIFRLKNLIKLTDK